VNELALIPQTDWADFGALPPHVKRKVRLRAAAIEALDHARADGKKATDVAKQRAAQLGIKWTGVFGMRSNFRSEGWRALVDKRLAGPSALNGTAWKTTRALNLPPPAVDHLKKLFGDYKRKSAPAARAFIRQWERWRDGDLSSQIPGFDRCPVCGPCGHPVGWSTRNLMTYLPSKFEMAAERRGLNFAVGKCGPQIFTTRATLYYMSHIMLDDVWHDNFVVFQRQGICRVVELDALEVFSGALAFWGCKPRLKRDDGTFDQALAKYVPLCLAALFSREGYSPRGTEILAEHGTAAVPERVRKLLSDATNNLIRTRESGITGEEQAVIGWRGQGKGNSRFKSLLEGHHSLKHNELAMIQGQTGLSRETRPEFTHGILCDDSDLLKAAAALAKKNPARAAQLRTRLLDYHSGFLPLLLEVYTIINSRSWHALEGWDKIPGNVQMQYRLAPTSTDWLCERDFQALPAPAQEMVLAAAAADNRYVQQHRLSPAEVQSRERGGLVKLPDWAVAELIGPDFGRETRVAGAYFHTFSDEEISAEPLRFESVVIDRDGKRSQLPDDTYFCILNPFDASRLFVHDAKQRFIGVADRAQRISRFDEDALRHAYGHRARRLKELTAPLIARHAQDIRDETKRLKENAALLAGDKQELAALADIATGALNNEQDH
jgi:hypothetical protein